MTIKLIQAGAMGLGKTLGQAGAEQATSGRWGKKLKTPGQIEVKAKSEYGYGKDDVKEINKDLQEQRKSTVDLETLGGNVTGEIMALGGDKLKDYGLDKLTDTKIGASINDRLVSTKGIGDVDKFKEGIQERYKALDTEGDDYDDFLFDEIEKTIPSYLFEEIDTVIVGTFDFLDERDLEDISRNLVGISLVSFDHLFITFSLCLFE